MPDSNPTAATSRFATLATWALKIVLALAFAAAASMKLAGQPPMVEEFDKIGLGQGFRYLTGAIELASGVMLLIPRSAFVGALGLVGICIGALVAQLSVLHGDIIHVFVLGGLACLAAWLSRPRA